MTKTTSDHIALLSSESTPTIHELMDAMPEHWRGRWCAGGPCGCMGAANCSGGLLRNGYKIEDWEAWKRDTGYIEPARVTPDFTKLDAALRAIPQRCSDVRMEDSAEITVSTSSSHTQD